MENSLLKDEKKVTRLIEDIAAAISKNDTQHFLNLTTWEVIYYDKDMDMATETMEAIELVPDNFIEITDIATTNIDLPLMKTFIDTAVATDSALQTALHDAVKGAKPFVNFKDVLAEKPAYQKKWYQYKEECYAEDAKKWLISYGILPA